MKKLIPLIIFFIFIQCSSDSSNLTSSSDSSNLTSEESTNTNSVQNTNSCDDIQDALNKVYLAYSEIEAGSLPSPATLELFLDL